MKHEIDGMVIDFNFCWLCYEKAIERLRDRLKLLEYHFTIYDGWIMSDTKNIMSPNDVLMVITQCLLSKVWDKLKWYNSPLDWIIGGIVEENIPEIESILRTAMSKTIKNKRFKEVIQEEFSRKVAKSLVWKLEWSVEKAVDKLRQDPTMRARIIIAIEEIINSSD